ncbi:MAG TPA: asparaginase [bacterium]|nr:asparaginase [bacterium]
MSNSDRKVLILSTGGTIAAAPRANGCLYPEPLTRERLLKAIPDLEAGCRIDVLPLMSKDSVNMEPQDWVTISETVYENINAYDGIVVIHGLDTLAYTAAALSLALHDLPVPVVLVGSATPCDFPASDAQEAISNAMLVACRSQIAEVCIMSDSRIIRGNRAKRIREIDLKNFASSGIPPLGYIDTKRITFQERYRKRSVCSCRIDAAFSPMVTGLTIYPGFPLKLLEAAIAAQPQSIVLMGYGSGCIPVEGAYSLLPLIEQYNQEILFVISSQIAHSQCWVEAHQVGDVLLQAGAVSAGDMTYETALVKLMWIHAHTSDRSETIHMLKSNYAGEISPQALNDADDYFVMK